MKAAATRPRPEDDRLWKALADPTRRAILDRLRGRPAPTGRLAEGFALTRFGVMKHLRVLQEAGLVLVEERGRERWNHLNPVPVRDLYRRWIRPFEEEDADRLLRIKHLATATPEPPMSTLEAPLAATTVLVETPIDAPLERVWRALVVETSAWWHPGYATGPSFQGFHIEPRLGGLMVEGWGDGSGQIWGHVEGVRAPEYLMVVGDSSKEWGGPARNVMTWRLSRSGAGSVLRLEHSLFGVVSAGTRDSVEEGWRVLFATCLKPFAETGVAPDFDAIAVPGC